MSSRKEKRKLKRSQERERSEEIDLILDSGKNPLWEGPLLDPAEVPSSISPMNEIVRPPSDPTKVRGEMVFLHKTAPVLQIQGKPVLSPDEMAAGRRR